MYDLPMEEPEQVKAYSQFRKKLLKIGFYQLQYSIYVKVVPTEAGYKTFLRKIQAEIPHQGNVRILKITEKQYESMVFLTGSKSMHELIVGDNELVVFKGEQDE